FGQAMEKKMYKNLFIHFFLHCLSKNTENNMKYHLSSSIVLLTILQFCQSSLGINFWNNPKNHSESLSLANEEFTIRLMCELERKANGTQNVAISPLGIG